MSSECLAAAGPNDHFVQFYEHDQFLAKSVAAFIGGGLCRGSAAILIITPEHHEALRAKLLESELDLQSAIAKGQYIALDAAETLSKFMHNGSPDRDLFNETVGRVIEKAIQDFGTVRAFGEMVALLWADGNAEAAIHLETLWDQLSKIHSFSLFCAYPIHGFEDASNQHHFARICEAHSRVLPSESFSSIRTEDERSRAIAALQQKALSLETEIEHRQKTERALEESEARFRAMFCQAAVGIAVVDCQGQLLEVNPRLCQMLGRSAESLCAFTCQQLTHQDDWACYQRMLDELSAGTRGEFIIEKRYSRGDGSWIWVKVSVAPLRDSQGRVDRLLAVVEDIQSKKTAELALRERDERHQLVLIGAEAGIWDWDVPNRRVLYSPRWKEMRGLTDADVSDSDEEWSQRIHPEDAPRVWAAVQAHFAGQTKFFCEEYRVRHKKGHWIWVLDRGVAKRDESGQVIRMAGSETDITERKRAEHELRVSEERIRQLVSLMPAAVYTCDEQGRITFFNRRAAELWGREPTLGDLDQRFCGAFKLWLPDGSPLPHEKTPMAAALFHGTSTRNREVIIERPDGSQVTVSVNIDPIVDSSGTRRGAINVFQDITVWKRGQEAMQRLAAIVESSDDAIIASDLNGVITNWNRGAERVFGYHADEVVGQHTAILIPQDKQDENDSISKRLRGGERITQHETVRRRKDGTLIEVSLTISPIKDSQGHVVGASNVARDITDKVRAKEKLEQIVAQRTAQLQETVAELEAFSYSVAHDMRAPLRSMHSYSRFLEEDFGQALPAEGRSFARRIADSASRLDSLITDVLNYSKIARGELPLDKVDIEKLTREIVDSYPDLRDSTATILIQSPIPPVVANKAALTQCISNLLSNAIKFVEPGARPQVRIRAEKKTDYVRVWVEDNGIGMSEEGQKRIFRMFHRLNPSDEFEGTGVGLTIVRKAVERMGGQVGVEAQLGVGSRFWFELSSAC